MSDHTTHKPVAFTFKNQYKIKIECDDTWTWNIYLFKSIFNCTIVGRYGEIGSLRHVFKLSLVNSLPLYTGLLYKFINIRCNKYFTYQNKYF